MIKYLEQKLNSALSKLKLSSYSPTFDRPRDAQFGDLFTNVALIIAKDQKRNPRDVAKEIISNLELSADYVSKTEIAGPGFINFFLSPAFLSRNLAEILKLKDSYGRFEAN